jgi:hypothetical protein
MKTVIRIIFLNLLVSISFTFGQSVLKESDGVVVIAPENVNGIKKLKLKVWDDNVIQVIASPASEFSTRESLIITGKVKSSTNWNVSESGNQLQVSTNSITVKVDKNNLKISFFNKKEEQILAEETKEAQPAKVLTENCFNIKQ